MENKKLLKFLYKDIAEIEELVTEKGAAGFDEFEIEFIQSRFKGAKQLIQILSDKENKSIKNIQPHFDSDVLEEKPVLVPDAQEESVPLKSEISVEEMERLKALADFEAEEQEKASEAEEQALHNEEEQQIERPEQTVLESDTQKEAEEDNETGLAEEDEIVREKPVVNKEEDFPNNLSTPGNIESSANEEVGDGVELDEEEEIDAANNRLGDRFAKENSVNELLGTGENGKLEYKISNSPVESLQKAIGINDRYQYIRELFGGSADDFSKAVTELDTLSTIQEAVNYLQQNYKWKKNETSLKFVNLVKRRFPNG